MLHIRVTRNRFKLTMYSNYAAYTPIDRFARTRCSFIIFTDYAGGAFFQPFKNSPRELLPLSHPSFLPPIPVSLPPGSVCQNSPDRRDDRALKYVAPTVSHRRFSPFPRFSPLEPSGIPQGGRHRAIDDIVPRGEPASDKFFRILRFFAPTVCAIRRERGRVIRSFTRSFVRSFRSFVRSLARSRRRERRIYLRGQMQYSRVCESICIVLVSSLPVPRLSPTPVGARALRHRPSLSRGDFSLVGSLPFALPDAPAVLFDRPLMFY